MFVFKLAKESRCGLKPQRYKDQKNGHEMLEKTDISFHLCISFSNKQAKMRVYDQS